jgi:hypothetical protein
LIHRKHGTQEKMNRTSLATATILFVAHNITVPFYSIALIMDDKNADTDDSSE